MRLSKLLSDTEGHARCVNRLLHDIDSRRPRSEQWVLVSPRDASGKRFAEQLARVLKSDNGEFHKFEIGEDDKGTVNCRTVHVTPFLLTVSRRTTRSAASGSSCSTSSARAAAS